MSELPKLDPKTSVVLSLDCQKGIMGSYPESNRVVKPARAVLAAARAHKISVIHVGIGFRAGYPEIPATHPMFARVAQGGKFIVGTESTDFHSEISPQAGEITIVKHRVSAFSGNDLEMILRSQGIKQMVFFGVATSGIVLSTLRQATDLDFHSVVIKDCCFDPDEEVHRVLTEKVFPRQATVVDAETFIAKMV